MMEKSNVSNTPYWHLGVDLNVQTTPLEQLGDHVDALIVGAGFTGLSAAITLARAGQTVAVIEAGDIACGASTRNGGLLGPSFHKLGIQGLIKKYGQQNADALLQESLKGYDWLLNFIESENIDCDLKRCGRFRGALKPAHFDGLASQAQSFADKLDYPVKIIEKADQHEEVGSDKYHGGVVYTKDSALNPAKLAKGLIDLCLKLGVNLLAQSKVENITQQAERFKVDIAQRTITADAILIATNGYTGSVTKSLKKRVLPLRSSMIATQELSPELMNSISPQMRTHGGTDRLVFYYRPSPDGKRLLFGGRALSYQDKPLEYRRFLQRNMCHLFPQLQQTQVTHAWSGLVAYSFDHIPHLGVNNGMYYAMGYCGSGVARANYLGHQVALKMLGQGGETCFDQFEFPSQKLYSGNPWFMPAILRWHSIADRWGL